MSAFQKLLQLLTPGILVNFPKGMTPDPSSDWGGFALMNAANNYAQNPAIVTSNATALDLTAVQVVGNGMLLRQGAPGGPVTDTLPNAVAMISQMQGPTNIPLEGTYSEPLRILNTTGQTITIATNTGLTLSGTMTIETGTWRDFMLTATSATTITVLNVGSGMIVSPSTFVNLTVDNLTVTTSALFSYLTANSFVFSGAAGLLSSTAAPTNGQLLIGSTGVAPVLGSIAGTANQIIVTPGAGTITLSAPQDIAPASSPTFANLTLSGNLTFSSTAQRILGDFSNATIANRLMFQSSTANGSTSVGVLPNGASTAAAVNIYATSDPTNSTFLQLVSLATDTSIRSAVSGAGVPLPLTMWTNTLERMRLTTAGDLGVGTTTPNYLALANSIAVTIQGASFGLLELASTAADAASTTIGALDFNYRTNSAGHQRVATIASVTEGATANQRGSSLRFFTKANGSTSLLQRAVIDSNGLVGIGMTPGTALDITAATNAGLRITDGTVSTIVFNTASTSSSIGTTSNHPLNLFTNNAGRVHITATGLVGIGITPTSGNFLEVHVASDRNLAIANEVQLTGSVSISALNDAASLNLPLEFRGSQFAFYGGGTQYLAISTTGDITGRGIEIVRTKTADTSRNTTTTLTADPDLTVSLAANTSYELTFFVVFLASVATAMGGKFALTYTGTFSGTGLGEANGDNGSWGISQRFIMNTTMINATADITTGLVLRGTIGLRTVNAGTLSIDWAQNTSNANNLSLKAGSYLNVTKLAG